MKTLFSWAVWKRPWPNLEVVSMNLSSIFSRARRLWCTTRDFLNVMTRFLVPAMHPFSITKSLLTSP